MALLNIFELSIISAPKQKLQSTRFTEWWYGESCKEVGELINCACSLNMVLILWNLASPLVGIEKSFPLSISFAPIFLIYPLAYQEWRPLCISYWKTGSRECVFWDKCRTDSLDDDLFRKLNIVGVSCQQMMMFLITNFTIVLFISLWISFFSLNPL